jgi:hypothetical protein
MAATGGRELPAIAGCGIISVTPLAAIIILNMQNSANLWESGCRAMQSNAPSKAGTIYIYTCTFQYY